MEQFGLPRTGGYYDQPYHFMEELRAADSGRRRREAVVRRNAQIQAKTKSLQRKLR